MSEGNSRNRTEEIVRRAVNGGDHDPKVVTDAIVTTLAARQLIYPHREENARRAVEAGFRSEKGGDGLADRIYDALIASGEIVGSWLY